MRGFIRERGSSFTAYWETKDPATGARRQHSRGGFATKAKAQHHLNVVVGKVTTGEWRADQPITVRELLVAHWLPAQRARELRPATLAQYEGVVEHWIVPRLGGTKVAALTPGAVVEFMAALRSEPSAKGRKGLSARSTQLAVGVLKAACAWAVQAEMIGRNPIASVRRPRAEGQAMRVWTSGEARAFLDATSGDRLAFAWALLLTRGLRRGELCGLRWSAIDLDAGTLRVESTLITVEGQAVSVAAENDGGPPFDPPRRATRRPAPGAPEAPARRAARGWARVRGERLPARRRPRAPVPPGHDLGLVRGEGRRDGPATHSLARLSPHGGEPHARFRRRGEGRLGDPRARVADDHALGLRARHAGHGGVGWRGALGEPARMMSPNPEVTSSTAERRRPDRLASRPRGRSVARCTSVHSDR